MLTTIPDCEMIVGKYLREHPDIDSRVASKLPAAFSQSWVRVTQLDASNHPDSPVEHLITYFIQFDAYAGTGDQGFNSQQQASELSRRVRAALHSLPQQQVDGLVVTRVIFTEHARVPDEAFEPARERYVLTAEVTGHAPA